jgi:hypothetical protein
MMNDDLKWERHAFVSPDGTNWTVREQSASPDRESCLIFDCDCASRRVRGFPTNWRDLDSVSLVALSWKV